MSNSGNLRWDQRKLREYFESCKLKYGAFKDVAIDLNKAYLEFINDDNHTGEEAESSKAFLHDIMQKMLSDIIYVMEAYESKCLKLLEDFKTDVIESDNARLDYERLTAINSDFVKYDDSLESVSKDITYIYNKIVEELDLQSTNLDVVKQVISKYMPDVIGASMIATATNKITDSICLDS